MKLLIILITTLTFTSVAIPATEEISKTVLTRMFRIVRELFQILFLVLLMEKDLNIQQVLKKSFFMKKIIQVHLWRRFFILNI